MSLCSLCAMELSGDRGLCPHHAGIYGADWHVANRLMCHFFHRGELMGGTWKYEESRRRFFLKVDMDGPIPVHHPHLGACHLWLGCLHSNGYGMVRRHDKAIYAHRFAFELEHGPIPDDLEIDHLCRVRRCVRVSHLELVEHIENLRRAREFRRLDLPRLTPAERADEFWAEAVA